MHENSPDRSRLKVYYNGACPVCRAGINSQRARMSRYEVDVEWIDIHTRPDRLGEIAAEQEFVRERLHVLDADGNLAIGEKAFAALWQKTLKQRWLARLVSLPGVRTLARWSYNAFAAGLYRWNRAKGRW